MKWSKKYNSCPSFFSSKSGIIGGIIKQQNMKTVQYVKIALRYKGVKEKKSVIIIAL